MQLGRGGPRHLGEGRVRDVGGAGELRRPELGRLVAQPGDLVLGHAVQDVARGLRDRVDDDQVSEPLEQVLHEAARVLARLHHPVHRAEHRGAVPGREGVDHVVEQGAVRVAQQGHGEVVADALLVGAGHELVEHGEGVADGSGARADHEGEHPRGHLHVLLGAELLQVVHERLGGDQPEGVVVGAGPDGGEHLARLGGREDELDVLRRLLDDLEQGVEALARDHVRLVDDEDLVPVPDGRERGALPQVAGVVHAAVAGRVHLDHVEGAGAVPGQVAAAVAAAARGGGGALRAVEAAGQDAGGGGLAAAARAGEEVGVADPVLAQRRHQRLGHVLLTDDVLEGLRAVAAVQGGSHR